MEQSLLNLYDLSDLFNGSPNPIIFVVNPNDKDDDQAVELAQQTAEILNSSWESAPSSLTVEEAIDPEQADLILADAFTILEDADSPAYDLFGISDVIRINDKAIVIGFLLDEAVEAESDEDQWD